MGVITSSTTGKVVASVALVAVAAGVASLGTFGSFTSTTSASEQVSTGTVVIGLSTPGAALSMDVPITGLVPGDTFSRVLTLGNVGSEDFAAITLTTTAAPSSLLDTDSTNGLQLRVDACSAAWTATGNPAAPVYTCTGATTAVLAPARIIGGDLALNGLSSLVAGSSDFLKITAVLPASSGNTFQGQSSTVKFAFTGTQRTATPR